MNGYSFEDLEVYKIAREFRKKIYNLTKELPEEEKLDEEAQRDGAPGCEVRLGDANHEILRAPDHAQRRERGEHGRPLAGHRTSWRTRSAVPSASAATVSDGWRSSAVGMRPASAT